MNPGNSNDSGNDPGNKELDLDLKEIESQYRTLHTDEPPAILDQAILNKASLAVESHAIRPWNFGWMHATATAAVLVLGLTLVLQQRSEVPAPLQIPAPIQIREEAESTLTDADTVVPDEMKFQEMSTTGEIFTDKLELKDSIDMNSIDSRLSAAKEDHALRRARQAATEKRADEPAPSFNDSIAAPTPSAAQAPAAAKMLRKNAEIPATVDDLAEISSVGAALASDQTEELQNPEDWMAFILQLRHQHESADGSTTRSWESELESFLQAWPDYPLPDEITDYLATRPASE